MINKRVVYSSKLCLNEEGLCVVGLNPTIGTPLLYPLTTVFSDTAMLFHLWNGETNLSGASRHRISLDYFKLLVAVAPASATQARFAVVLDNVSRFTQPGPPANATNITPAITIIGPSSPPIGTLTVQNSATAAVINASSASKKIIANGNLGGLPIVGDELVVVFGGNDPGGYGGTATAGRKVTAAPPAFAGVGSSLTMHMWFPGNAVTPLTYEFELSWFEIPLE